MLDSFVRTFRLFEELLVLADTPTRFAMSSPKIVRGQHLPDMARQDLILHIDQIRHLGERQPVHLLARGKLASLCL